MNIFKVIYIQFTNSLDLLPKMLDDMLKICLDPYFKPKNVEDPNRENLFELVYSPGKTINTKEKVNLRREITWDHLYPTKEQVDAFLQERLSTHKTRLMKIKGIKSVKKSPKKEMKEVLRSNTTRDDLKSIKVVTNDNSLSLYPEYTTSNNVRKQVSKMGRFDSVKELPDRKLHRYASRTQTHLPQIRNPSRDMYVPSKVMSKQFQNPNEYALRAMYI